MINNYEQVTEKNQKTEENAIDEIMSTIQEEEDNESKTVFISYGSKKMKIEIRKKTEVSGGKLVTTFIENIKPKDDRKEDETTFLYLTAKKIIQKAANDSGQSLCYLFDTENSNLTQWAGTAGEEIFEWDSKDTMATQTLQHTFVKIFYPDSK